MSRRPGGERDEGKSKKQPAQDSSTPPPRRRQILRRTEAASRQQKQQHSRQAAKERRAQRKDYRFFKCPGCGTMLRVPRGKGKIHIKCKCGYTLYRKT